MAELDRIPESLAGKAGRTTVKKGRVYFEVAAKDLHDVVRVLFSEMGCRLSTASAMEMRRGLEVLYHFSDDASGRYYCPRVVVADLQNPKVPSIAPLVKGAEWIEREMAELFGIVFEGHPRPGRLLTMDRPHPPDRPLRLRREP